MIKRAEIKIVEPFYSKPWVRNIRAVLVAIVPIGVGVAVDSSAMQWMGFVMTFFAILILAGFETSDGLTIDEARAKLDEIERKIEDSHKRAL